MNLNEFTTISQADTPAAVELPKQFKKEEFDGIEVHKALRNFFNKVNPGNEEPYSFTHIGSCFLELGQPSMSFTLSKDARGNYFYQYLKKHTAAFEFSFEGNFRLRRIAIPYKNANGDIRFLFMFADADIYKPGAQMKDTHRLTMFLIGDPKEAEVFSWFVKHMEPQHDTTETIKLTEFHLGAQGIAERSKLIPLNTIRTAKQEFYPAIDNNIYQLYDRFMASPSNIWLLVGPRGTGKTTFIRTLAAHSGCPAHICSDTTTMCNPAGAQHISQLANGDEKNLIVVEDAGEEFLGPRTEGNRTMASILNIFEGVLPASGKLIITTNVIDVNKMDPALLRPGRLFATTWFGFLNHKQANKALKSVGKKPITEKKYLEIKADQKEGITLAQVLNLETQDLVRVQRKFGFTG